MHSSIIVKMLLNFITFALDYTDT